MEFHLWVSILVLIIMPSYVEGSTSTCNNKYYNHPKRAKRCEDYFSTGSYQPNQNVTEEDKDRIKFALNLEYLEVEYFLCSAFGFGLAKFSPKLTGGGPYPVGCQRACLDEFTFNISKQFGFQEIDHIRAIKDTTGIFQEPLLNISKGVWAEFMDKAFETQLDPPFDPYGDSTRFLIASYMLPYVGLTGYVGSNPLLASTTVKRLVAGLLGIESRQDAVIRTILYAKKDEMVDEYNYTVANFIRKISKIRNELGMTGIVDEGVELDTKCLGANNRTTQNVLSGDTYSLSYSRTPSQILGILYGTRDASQPGGFYPEGAHGEIARSFLNYTYI